MDEYYTFYISLWRVFNKGRSREKNDQEKKEKKRRDTMEIQKTAIAGTLESSDAQITVEPAENGIELTLDSSVMNQYGRQINWKHLTEIRKSAFWHFLCLSLQLLDFSMM